MSGPSDGYAYNRIELQAIWDMKVDPDLVVKARERMFEFLEYIGATNLANLIVRDSAAQFADPEPQEGTPHDSDTCPYCKSS